MPFQALSTGEKLEKHVRARFREWFDESGLTQAQAGDAIEWKQQTVAAYFGGGQQIDLIRAVTWCEFFGRTIVDLLEKSPNLKEDPRRKMWNDGFNRQSDDMKTSLLGLIGALPSVAQRGQRAPRRRTSQRKG